MSTLAVEDTGDGKGKINTQLGPLKIELKAPRKVVSDLTLDLVSKKPIPSPPDEPKVECTIYFGEQGITFEESRAWTASYINDLLYGYPKIAEQQKKDSDDPPRRK